MKRMHIQSDGTNGKSLAIKAIFFFLPILLIAQQTDGTGDADEERPRVGIVEIRTPISTEFGTYVPYRVPAYAASVGFSETGLRPDLSNVTIPGRFSWESYFSASDRSALARDRIVLRPEPMGSFAQAYVGMNDQPDFAPFITTDAAMAGLQATMEEAYRRAQRDYLTPTLRSVLEALSRNLSNGMSNESNASLKEAFRNALAWTETARLLLDPAASPNGSVADDVQDEIRKIEAGVSASSEVIPDRRIDYSMFVPAGHYAVNHELGNYYRAKVWLSRVGLQLGATNGAARPAEARMATVLARAIDAMNERERDALATVAGLERFFAGRDVTALTPDVIAAAMRAYYGFQYAGSASYLGDDASLNRVVDYLNRSLPDVMRSEQTLTMRLLPRESSLSESIFAAIQRGQGAGSNGRTLIGALQRAGGNESREIRSLRTSLTRIPAEDWVQDLELTTLYTAQLLAAEEESDGLPKFMQSNAWKERKAESALGAWSAVLNGPGQLTTSSRAGSEIETTSYAGFSTGYVEPNPIAWSAIASQARYVREGLAGGVGGDILNRALEDKLRDIENSATQFARIAAQELAGRELTSEQVALITAAPQHIAAWEAFTDQSLRGGQTLLTASASRGAGAVGPATGHPVALYVIVPSPEDPRELVLMRGAVYSYHETGMGGEEWVRAVTSSGASSADAYVVPASEIKTVQVKLPKVTAAVQERDRRSAASAVQVELESNVVRRSSGAVWYTVYAAGYDGADVVTTVVDASGRQVFQSFPLPIENGQRYDMVPTDEMKSGHYFVRVSDITGRTLASGRFLLVQ